MKVDAVVVTYNRLEKLKECLDKLLEFNLENIFVIDNASNDGTEPYMKWMETCVENITSIRLSKNIGGAGGFNFGLKQFIKNSTSDYVWVMDDDTIPQDNSLELLVKAMNGNDENEKVGFATGQVYWTDGNLAEMNLPVLSSKEHINADYNYVAEASFVAILFSREAIKEVGYPITDFFIWGDDVEYTDRMNRLGFVGIQVKNSKIIHKMGENVGVNILKENNNKGRIKRYFYNYRNRFYLNKQKGRLRAFRTFAGRILTVFKILGNDNRYKLLKISVLLKGTWSGIFFDPEIEK